MGRASSWGHAHRGYHLTVEAEAGLMRLSAHDNEVVQLLSETQSEAQKFPPQKGLLLYRHLFCVCVRALTP